MKTNKTLLTFLITMSLCLGISACGTANQPVKTPPAKKNTTNQAGVTEKGNTITKQNAVQELTGENKTLHDRAEKIATEISKIPGVNKAYVSISKKNALIGLNINKDFEGKVTEDLRKKVEDTVKKTDKDIQTVATTAEPDLTERIKKVGEDIKAGKPLSGLGTELEEIFSRIIPK